MNDIILIVDGTGGTDLGIQDLFGFARKLRSMTGGAVRVWVPGEHVEDTAQEIARFSGFDVTALSCPGLSRYVCEAYRTLLVPLIQESAPAFVCTAHTSCGSEWAPAVAAGLGAGCICGVDGLLRENGGICFTKDRYGGKVKGRYRSHAATTVLTVQPGSFPFQPQEKDPLPGTVVRRPVSCHLFRTRFEGIATAASDTADIAEAGIIVAAGSGVGDAENMELIHRLAELFPKAAVAGSRIVCDLGWLGYDRQVGVTGNTVAPALYIACGISGASQHLVGMRGSGFVVAINTDAHAPIFSEADLCIAEDLTRFIPLVVEAHEKMTENGN